MLNLVPRSPKFKLKLLLEIEFIFSFFLTLDDLRLGASAGGRAVIIGGGDGPRDLGGRGSLGGGAVVAGGRDPLAALVVALADAALVEEPAAQMVEVHADISLKAKGEFSIFEGGVVSVRLRRVRMVFNAM